jgi:hypothetical protein
VIQGTFGAIQGTFSVIQGTFGVIQGTFGGVQGTFAAGYNRTLYVRTFESESLIPKQKFETEIRTSKRKLKIMAAGGHFLPATHRGN